MKTGMLEHGVIQWTNGTTMPFDTPQIALNNIMHSGDEKHVIYSCGIDPLLPFIRHVVSAFPHDPNHSGLSWDSIVTTNGKFYSFEMTLSKKKRFLFYDIRNILHSTCEDILKSYGTFNNALLELERLGLQRVTAGSAAMHEFTDGRGPWYAEKFPRLSDEQKTDIRSGYIGGYMKAEPGEYGEVLDLDINSMYPWVLHDQWLPYGAPEEYDGEYVEDDDMPLHCDILTFRADLKPDGFPFLTDGMMQFDAEKRMESTRGFITQCLTDIDQQLLYENYNVTVFEHVKGYKFRRSKGMFYSYVNEWYDMKKKAHGARRELAKIMLNSLVGKMAALNRGYGLLPKIDIDGALTWQPYHRKQSSFSTDYLPVPMWVNAYARRELLRAARLNRHRLIYANTDGLMLTGHDAPDGITIDDSELGAWKVSGRFVKVVILGINRFQAQDENGDIRLVHSGSSITGPIPWECYRSGMSVVDADGDTVVL